MFDLIPRLLWAIFLDILFSTKKKLTEKHEVSFRVWPFLDSEHVGLLSAPRMLFYCAIAAWSHGYVGGFIRPALRNGWRVVVRRSYFEFFYPIRVFKKVTVRTWLVAHDEFSVIRKFEFFVGEKLCARAHLQLVVVNFKLKRIRSEEWLAKMNLNPADLSEWPQELEAWHSSRKLNP